MGLTEHGNSGKSTYTNTHLSGGGGGVPVHEVGGVPHFALVRARASSCPHFRGAHHAHRHQAVATAARDLHDSNKVNGSQIARKVEVEVATSKEKFKRR